MKFLREFGFSDELIDLIEKNLPNTAITRLKEEEKTVVANLRYLKDLGINNYVDAFIRFYNMFLIDNSAFDEIFSKYDRDDLIAKLEKNIAIMEYL